MKTALSLMLALATTTALAEPLPVAKPGPGGSHARAHRTGQQGPSRRDHCDRGEDLALRACRGRATRRWAHRVQAL